MKTLVYFIAILGLLLIGCKNVGTKDNESNLSPSQIDTVAMSDTVAISEPLQVVSVSSRTSYGDTSNIRRAVMVWKHFYNYLDTASRALSNASLKMDGRLSRDLHDLFVTVSNFEDSIMDGNIYSMMKSDTFDIEQYQFIIGFYLYKPGHQFANQNLGSSLENHFSKNPGDFDKLVKFLKDDFQSEYSILLYRISESVFVGWTENEFDNLLAQGIDLNDFQSEKDNLYTLFKINHAFITDELEAAGIDILDKY